MRLALVVHCNGKDPSELEFLLEALTSLNCFYLTAHPRLPRLYESGVVYAVEPTHQQSVASSEERIASIPEVLRLGWGDCDDLVCWLAAERRVRDGLPAKPLLVLEGVSPDGSHNWHCVVGYPNGATEDPSEVLGMGRNQLQGMYPEELQ